MTDAAEVRRDMLRSTSVIGGATVGGLIVGMVRMKLLAILIGPAGVGLFGLLNTIMTLGAAVAGMGIDSSSVRQLAASADDPERSRVARWGLWTFAWPLAATGTLLMWLARAPLAEFALGSRGYADEVGWIALGVGATIISAAQLGQIQAWRRIGDLARIRLSSAMVAAVAGVAAVYLYGDGGVLIAVLALPLATCAAGLWFSRSLPAWKPGRFPGRKVTEEWRALAGIGSAVMLTAAVGTATQAAVRAILTQRLGLDAAGLFQASFAISSINLGLVLGAMIPEYYPRLSAAADDPKKVGEILNHQVHVGLLLAGPALLGISAAAPYLLQLLYTSEFTGAALLLRLQVTADALRVAGWALGFVLLARNRRLSYFLVEAALAAVFVPLTWLAAERFGVASAGGAYLLGYLASVLVAAVFTLRDGIRINASNALMLACLVLLLLVIASASLLSNWAALGVGGVAFAMAAAFSFRELRKIGLPLPSFAASLMRRPMPPEQP